MSPNRLPPNRKILLFNPRATSFCRVPNSVLHLAAALEGIAEFEIVDGNREQDPWGTLHDLLSSGQFGYFACTVMPGPQLKQAIPVTRRIRETFPDIIILWGGYFPSNQPDVTVQSPWVDYVIDGPGEDTLPALLQALTQGTPLTGIPGLVYRQDGVTIRTGRAAIPDLDAQPPLPLDRLAQRYPLRGYLPRTFLGTRTHAMHTSMGCPFTCGFCAVVPIYQGRWKARSADCIADDALAMRDRHGMNAIEFNDNNFFVSEKRVRAFCDRMQGQGIIWWGEGRIDTLDLYSDETLARMHDAGCRMIFFGAESGDDSILSQVDKGGKQSGAQILSFARRLLSFDIVPEYSFVLGFPRPTEAEVWEQIHRDIAFIRRLKDQSPQTEVILYIYSPVPGKDSTLGKSARDSGFTFPQTLEDWLTPAWESFDLHRNPLTPWLTPAMVRHIHDFETVLNARFPSKTDFTLNRWIRRSMALLSAARYAAGIYRLPWELKALQRLGRYTRPEVEGFAARPS